MDQNVIIDPSVAPTQIMGVFSSPTVWVAGYYCNPPDNSQTQLFQQVCFAPPAGDTNPPASVHIDAGPELSTLYTGSWLYPAFYFPACVEMAFKILKNGGGNWPAPIQVTITLTYVDR